MGKRHLTLKDRAELEALYNKGSGVEEIAAKLTAVSYTHLTLPTT